MVSMKALKTELWRTETACGLDFKRTADGLLYASDCLEALIVEVARALYIDMEVGKKDNTK